MKKDKIKEIIKTDKFKTTIMNIVGLSIVCVLVGIIIYLYYTGKDVNVNDTIVEKVIEKPIDTTCINILDVIIFQKDKEIRKQIAEQEAKVKEAQILLNKKRNDYLNTGGTIDEWLIIKKIMNYQIEIKRAFVEFEIKSNLLHKYLEDQDSILTNMVQYRYEKEMLLVKQVQDGLKDTTIIKGNDTIVIIKNKE